MPIYDYRCTACGFEKEFLQKVSDPVMTTCPACSLETLVKKLTAAGFQLKGSGWYATDFRNSGAPKPAAAENDAPGAEAKVSGADAKAAGADAKAPGADTRAPAATADQKAAVPPDAKPAAGPATSAPAPAAGTD